MKIIALQLDLRPALPNVYGTLDYRNFRDTLCKMDDILVKSGLEHELVSEALNQQIASGELSGKQLSFMYKRLKHALRCNIARHLTGESYRQFSMRLADSELFQWFTGISAFGTRKAISKSTLERYEKYFSESFVADLIRKWLAGLSDADKAEQSALKSPIDFHQVFSDTTCIKANIHFPVDWVLLRDAARSLLSAINTIRQQGLKNRMKEPSQLLKEVNKLCIEMTHSRRQKEGNKKRKYVLRKIKKLIQCIRKHAERYHALLLKDWPKTDWSEAQMSQVIARLDNILKQLPTALHQAHERIIGERLIKSSEKILSLYDKEAAVIVRGKADNEVEFGQRLLLAEQVNGLIIDWQIFSKISKKDNQLLKPMVKRLEKYYGPVKSVSTDRGFSSAENDKFLKEKNIYNATCPKSPVQLQERLTDPVFIKSQTRRSQTEARIGIFKNVFLGKPLRSRIIENKRHAVNWCVLTHNLWVLARKILAEEKILLEKLQEAA